MQRKIIWSGLIAFYFIGDTATTIGMLEMGYWEINPVVRWSLRTGGYPLFIFLKAISMAQIRLFERIWPIPFGKIFPLVAALMGFYATLNNTLLIVG